MRLKVAGFAGLLTSVLLQLNPTPRAEACGVKLTVKPSAPRKSVARTTNPSQVLLVGSPPRRHPRDLTASGHRVEVASDLGAAKRTTYGVVIVDSEAQASAARERFQGSVVLVRSGDVRNDLVAVEDRVARRPVAVAAGRPAVAARATRQPIAAGPDQQPAKEIVTAKPDEPPAVAAIEPAPTPAPPANRPAERPQRVTTPGPREETRARPANVDAVHEEIFFSVASTKVSGARALHRTAAWLNANASAKVTLEGHADPSGTPEGNLVLSEQRAQAVRDYFVAQGIDAARIEVKALGDTQLKYDARDRRNRRVAIDGSR